MVSTEILTEINPTEIKKDKPIEAAYQIGVDRESLPLFNVKFYGSVGGVCVCVWCVCGVCEICVCVWCVCGVCM